MEHQYKAGDMVTVFQISSSKELVIEGKATIRKSGCFGILILTLLRSKRQEVYPV